MKNKYSIGIVIIGVIFILFSLFCLVGNLTNYIGNWPRLVAYSLLLISGIGLVFLRKWARILSFFPMLYLLIVDVIFHMNLVELPFKIAVIAFIYYLTRPKVKEQFK